MTEKDRLYCIEECPIGKAKDAEFLEKNNSAYDAAMDMYWFVKECAKTCKRYSKSVSKTVFEDKD